MWYGVHAILYFRLSETTQQDEFLVWEHIYLIEANGFEDAREKGMARAQLDEGDDQGTLTVDDKAARLTFAGIRKVVECQDLDPASGRPMDGTELSYSKLVVSGQRAFKALCGGGSVEVQYQE